MSSRVASTFAPLLILAISPALSAADGFGAGATGGAGGASVTVMTSAQLTQYATNSGSTPYIITVSGTIDVTGATGGEGKSVLVRSNKTIQGAGSDAKIIGGFDVNTANNVIIQNLAITNPRTTLNPSDSTEYLNSGDGIQVYRSTNVFITHCTFVDCSDGMIDIVQQADLVTVSWCKFYYTAAQTIHRFSNLIGNDDGVTADAGKLRVTMHHNWWSSLCRERMPRVRYGRLHVYNNYYSCTGNNYCARAALESELLIEGNYFDNVSTPWQYYITTGNPGLIKASGNLFVNTTQPSGGADAVFTPSYSYVLDAAGTVKDLVMAGAGVPQVVISAAGSAIIGETGVPANNAVDAGETVTVELGLQNTGTLATTNLQATLRAPGGVTLPSGPQNYGAVAGGGAVATRSFTFTADAAATGSVTATLELQDGANSLGTVTFSFSIGARAGMFAENFDGVAAPALPSGWTAQATGAQVAWVTSTGAADTAANAAFVPGPAAQGISELTTPIISLTGGSPLLTFRHRYNLQSSGTTTGRDAGVLQIKIGSGAFTDVIAAGGSFVSGGYNRSLSNSTNTNPMGGGGTPVWSGNSSTFVTTSVNLPPSAVGIPIQLRWRCGSDASTASALGWYIDTISISTLSSIDTSADLALAKSAYPNPAVGGQNLEYTLTVTNQGPSNAADVKVTDTLPAGVTFVSASASQGGATHASGTVTAALGTLNVGASATVSVIVKPATSGGQIPNTASVASNQSDSTPSNNSVSINTTVEADSDGDGMSDNYETANGLDQNDPADAAGDKDGDGVGNLDESHAGTKANDAGSVLTITATTVDPGGGHVTFPTVAGRKYRVEYNNDLSSGGWVILADQVVGNGSARTITDPGAGAMAKRFYRVGVILP